MVYEWGGTPVTSSPLSVFLTKELNSTTFHSTNYPYQDSCIVINSREEFQAAFFSKEQLPEVDFQNNTLVICQTSAADTSYKLGHVSLKEKPDNYELQMTIFAEGSDAFCMIMHIYYWRLFPKLKDKKIILKPTIKK